MTSTGVKNVLDPAVLMSLFRGLGGQRPVIHQPFHAAARRSWADAKVGEAVGRRLADARIEDADERSVRLTRVTKLRLVADQS